MMTLLTAADLTANQSSSKAPQPRKTARLARWRSGDAADCKSTAARPHNPHFSDVASLFMAPNYVGKSSRLLTAEGRFWSKVERQDSGCWHWTAATGAGGYGSFKVGRKTITAHRFALTCKSPPPFCGAVVRHACDNIICVNPDHLCWGTRADNEADKGRSVADRIAEIAHLNGGAS